MGIYRTVSEIDGDFSRNIAKFSNPPVYFMPPLKGFPRHWLPAPKKTRVLGLTRPRKMFDDIFSRVDTIHQCDGQTDGRTQTPGDSKDRAYA